ncbi:unnamed protein product [Orchesella dallaii]|uniref:Peptidase S1 domain-containing protein n=1 Tax=Orchesella dallaii TaxID=48710 RepID=A0ABP1S8X3_9HEXA
MAKSSGYLWAGVASITILLQLANVNSQSCNVFPGPRQCPYGYNEVFSYVTNGQITQRGCCLPNANKEDRMALAATAEGCETTWCSPLHVPDPCNYIVGDFIVNGTRLVYEEVHRETCSSSQYPTGNRAYCCRPNSLEGALASTYGAEPNEFPHQVGVSVQGHVCGGTIYNKRYIITAAHCVVDSEAPRRVTPVYPKQNYKVTIGTNMWTDRSPKDLYGVEEVIVHEKYSKLEGSEELKKLETGEVKDARWLRTYNDIALLRLDRDITFGPSVKALRLADKGFNPADYAKTAVIAGWGTSESGRVMGYLQKASMKIRSDDRCFNIENYVRFGELRDKLLCLGGIVDGEWNPGNF